MVALGLGEGNPPILFGFGTKFYFDNKYLNEKLPE